MRTDRDQDLGCRSQLPFLLFSALCLLLVQCTSTEPGFDRLLSNADPNPPPDAVVGMWHKRHDAAQEKFRTSVLLGADHTGVYRGTHDGRVLADDDLTWQYIGSGLWEIRWKKIGMYSPMAGKATCRLTMSRDFLLWSYNDGPMGMCNLFFERVE